MVIVDAAMDEDDRGAAPLVEVVQATPLTTIRAGSMDRFIAPSSALVQPDPILIRRGPALSALSVDGKKRSCPPPWILHGSPDRPGPSQYRPGVHPMHRVRGHGNDRLR